MQTFAEQLALARKEAHLTQEELANAIHVARNTVSSWETGRTRPDLELMRTLSQVLQYDFMGTLEAQEEETPSAEAPITEAAILESPAEEMPSAAPLRSEEKRRIPKNALLIGGTVLALVLAACLLFLLLQNRPVTEARSADGTLYRIADYQAVTPNEPGKAYLTIDTVTETRQGDGMVFWMYSFLLREDNGIDFHMERLENIWFKRDSAQPFVYLENDLITAEVGPDIPARQEIEFTGGMPFDQTNMVGVGMLVYGHDANGAEETFTAYIPFPQR